MPFRPPSPVIRAAAAKPPLRGVTPAPGNEKRPKRGGSRRKGYLVRSLVQWGQRVASSAISILQIGADAGLLGGLGRLFELGAHLVDHLDEQEDAQRDQDKVDQGLQEVAVGEDRAVLHVAELDAQAGKVDPAGEQREQRHEQVVDHAGDDFAERAGDHHADGHVDDVALEGEVAKFLEQLFHERFLRS